MPSAFEQASDFREQDQQPDAAVVETPKAAKKKKGKERARKTADDRVQFAAALGGSRGWQKALRWVTAIAALVIAAVGIKQIVSPREGVSDSDLKAEVSQQLTESTKFPSVAAEGFATAFATTYFTWSSDIAAERTAALKAYLPATIKDGWDGKGSQAITSGPFIVRATTVESEHQGVVHLGMQTDKGTWLYVGVVVHAQSPTSMVVVATPALEPAPAKADYDGYDVGAIDNEASNALATDMPGFFAAWGASKPAELQRYLAPKPTSAAQDGLHGAVILASVDDVDVTAGKGDTRTAIVTVTWSLGGLDDPDASSLVQTYQLTIERLDGRWYVKDIIVGQPDTAADKAPAPSSGSSPSTSATPDQPSTEPTPGG